MYFLFCRETETKDRNGEESETGPMLKESKKEKKINKTNNCIPRYTCIFILFHDVHVFLFYRQRKQMKTERRRVKRIGIQDFILY